MVRALALIAGSVPEGSPKTLLNSDRD